MKKTLVIGLGVSGKAATEFLLNLGFQVVAVDKNEHLLKNDLYLQTLQKKGLEIVHEKAFSDFDSIGKVVLSPGIPLSHPLCHEASIRGIEIIGEIELGCRMIRNRMLGITGTNGKTTVTLLVAHVLNNCGIKAKALGNVGTPLTKELLQIDSNEIVVIELSSYQLETLSQRVLDAAVILNITPDHLDRYQTMQNYAAAKFLIADCLKRDAPLYVEAKTWEEYPLQKDVQLYGYSKQMAFYTDLEDLFYKGDFQLHLPQFLRGKENHDLENFMAAFALCRHMGVSPQQFLDAFATFKKPSHRIEWVRELNGVSYFDDSKGTNIDATIRAVQCMHGEVVLIAGGVDKGFPYTPWIEAFANKVKSICVIGQAADKIRKDLEKAFIIKTCNSLEEAVLEAKKAAKSGDVILLSPGCSSFDMFKDYAHRGDEFQKVVRGL